MTLFETLSDGLDASIDGRGWGKEHQDAMELCNAAPFMLKALTAIDSGECRDHGPNGDIIVPSHIVDLFRQAIAKAEGRVS